MIYHIYKFNLFQLEVQFVSRILKRDIKYIKFLNVVLRGAQFTTLIKKRPLESDFLNSLYSQMQS